MEDTITQEIKKSEKIAFTEQDLEEMGLGSAKTFKRDRYEGKGLPFVKIGRRVRYLKSDLLDYLNSNRVVPQKDKN
jgi:hypothetical protein